MFELCKQSPFSIQLIVAVGFAIWEAWLGKTKVIKPNSTIELLAMVAVALISKPKKDEKNDKSI